MELVSEIEKQDSRFASSFLDELESFMDDEEIQSLNIEDPETFHIVSKEQANYFIKKIKDARTEMEEINEAAKHEIEKVTKRVTEWKEKELAKRQRDVEYISNLLQEFAKEEVKNLKGKTKSISLPYGSIGFRKQPDKYDYDDEVLTKYLQDKKLEDFYTLKPVPNKSELKKQATVKEGKLYVGAVEIEGVTITSQEDKFEIK